MTENVDASEYLRVPIERVIMEPDVIISVSGNVQISLD